MAISSHQPIQPRCQARQNMAEAQISPWRRKGGQRGSGRARGGARAWEHPARTLRGVPLPPPAQPAWQAPTSGSQAPKPSLPTYPSQHGEGGASLHVHSVHSPKKPGHLLRRRPGHLRVASPETTGEELCPPAVPEAAPQIPTFS